MPSLDLIWSVLQMFLFIIVSPGVIGTLRALERRLQGRQGPSVIQPYYDLWKWFHRQPVIPVSASWVFHVAPLVVFCCFALAGFLLPIVYLPAWGFEDPWGPPLADFIVIAGLLSLGRFMIGLAGMDCGSPYSGLGSAREMYMHFMAEPVLLLSAYSLALNSHTTSLNGIMHIGQKAGLVGLFSNPSLWFCGIALVIIMLSEVGRIPFDSPDSHLELTMLGKAILLEYSGPHLALLEWAEAMRLTFFMAFIMNLFFPFWLAAPAAGAEVNLIRILLFPLKLFLMIIILSIWETTRPKLRLGRVLGPGSAALAFAIMAVIVAVMMEFFARRP